MDKVNGLRSALALLAATPGQLAKCDRSVEPRAELCGVYRYVGAGGTVKRPTQEGPALIFNNIKGHPGARVAIGVLASRKRVGLLLNCEPRRLGDLLNEAVDRALPPVTVSGEGAPCREVVHLATEPGFDIRKLVPAPTNTAEDAGPYITLGMAGIPTEASIIRMVNAAMPGRLQNVYCHSAGGGKYMAVLQFKKSVPSDEGRQRQAALLAFSAFSELKHVFLVDEDVDPFDSSDVLWALNTRYQGDVDTVLIPGVRCHPLDPTQEPEYNGALRDRGISCKTIFDCTVPYALKERFQRAKFMELDPADYVPELFPKG